MAKMQEVMRTKPQDASPAAAIVAPAAAVVAQPPNPPRPVQQQQQQVVDENLLRQLADMVRSQVRKLNHMLWSVNLMLWSVNLMLPCLSLPSRAFLGTVRPDPFLPLATPGASRQ